MNISKPFIYLFVVTTFLSLLVNFASFFSAGYNTQKTVKEAKTKVIEKVNSEDTIYLNKNYDNAVHPTPYCRFGLQFLIVLPNDNYFKPDSSIVQVFDVDPKTGMSVPMKCKDFALTKPESKK